MLRRGAGAENKLLERIVSAAGQCMNAINPEDVTPDEAHGYAEKESGTTSANLDQIYHSHYEPLLCFLRARLGCNKRFAVEIAEESFYRMAQVTDASLPSRCLPKLLYQIAKNILIDFYRLGKVIRTACKVDIDGRELPVSPSTTMGKIATDRWEQEKLARVVLGLPPHSRRVFVLSRFEGMTHAEISCRCGISETSVEEYFVEAMQIIRQQMAK